MTRAEELDRQFDKEKEALREYWFYRLDQAIAEALEPILDRQTDAFSAYRSAVNVYGKNKNVAAYEVGCQMGRAVASGRFPAVARDDIELSDILGNAFPAEELRAAWAAVSAQLLFGQKKFLELYDTVIEEMQGFQEIYASYLGFQTSEIDREWRQWFQDRFFPMRDAESVWF